LPNSIRENQQSFTWFLGAGCSVTSGIPDAGGLVRKWLTEIYGFQKRTAKDETFEVWVKGHHPDYNPNNLASYYAEAFEARHPSPVERQREIEMICASGQPNYGYATLAQLISHNIYGRLCGTVLTTNFDDLIADALYLYGEQRARPLVVTHEALARYVRTNSPRPTVVKLHGDAHLDPKNLRPETREIHKSISDQLYPFLQDHALIFCGYGGNDRSIFEFFQKMSDAAACAAAILG
jgi:NAD-dependent SIR2 family protein deacetylase